MSIKSGFFNSINGDRRYDARWFAQYFATFIGNGVFPNPSTGLQVMADTQMRTIVKPGKGWINGYYVVNDDNYLIQHEIADGVGQRIDRIVMRLDYVERVIKILVKKGSYTDFKAPDLQRDLEAYELALADVLIGKGSTQIIQGSITDLRLNNDVCGIVHSLVDQVDTTTIFNQYKSWLDSQMALYDTTLADWIAIKKDNFEQWDAAQKASFEQWTAQEKELFAEWQDIQKNDFIAWFDSIKQILDEDAVGNILNELNSLEIRMNAVERGVQRLMIDKEINDKVDNGYVFYYSQGLMPQNIKLLHEAYTLLAPVDVGTTILPISGFAVGQEVTIFDDIASEDVIVKTVTDSTITISPLKNAYKRGAKMVQTTVDIPFVKYDVVSEVV